MTKKEKFESMPEEFQNMVYTWPFANVLHGDIKEFSFGALSKSRLANILCEGDDVPPTFRILKKKASDKIDLAFWLFSRTQKMNKKDN